MLITNDIPITAEALKNELLGIRVKERMLMPIFQEHNNRVEALINQEFAPGTLERYKTSLKHTQEFIEIAEEYIKKNLFKSLLIAVGLGYFFRKILK